MTVFWWYRKFQRKKFSLKDAKRTRSVHTSISEDNITDMRKVFDEYRRVIHCLNEETFGLNLLDSKRSRV